MPCAARRKSKTGIYHIIVRGINRQEIFHDDQDRITYLKTLQRYALLFGLKVYAWCLMDNHVHLLVEEGAEDISITMKRIGVSYVHYYHWKYKTSGHFFENRYKSEVVESKRYFLTVLRYIHQNPLKAGMVKHAVEWEWSNCRGYYENGAFPAGLLNSEPVLLMFAAESEDGKIPFRQFNEVLNIDACMEFTEKNQFRLTDDEARKKIKKVLPSTEIAHVKSMAKKQRDHFLREVKMVPGVSHRQAARILGVSVTLVTRA
ncbi:transposase [Bacillus salacetis]|uniref:Transposase n=1 Tax=Bacillus salacetis TaxID=2315464 RepID=A0A3A1QYT4_9BACI|nr:transposase [Bacillus salacetis]RIW34267.1 transposase [Bacillus salacetis]